MRNMSVSAIMKNILTFAEILSQSSGRHAQHWDSHSLKNALKWATYCQQICRQASAKGCLSDLDEQVRRLVIYLRPATCMELTVDTLTNSSHVLRKNVLQNPFISEALFEEVLKLYGTGDSLLQECRDIACSRASADVVLTLDASLVPEQHRLKSTDAMCQGEQLLQKLVKQKMLHVNHENRFVEYVAVLLRQLVSEEGGWDVILSLLLCDVKDSVTSVESLKQLIVDWIVRSKLEFAHGCSKILACHVSGVCDQFRECYTGQLVKWGNEMGVRYSQPGEQPLYTWRWKGSTTEDRGYDYLLGRWTCLASHSRTQKLAHDRLTQLSLRDQPNIWRDITKHVYSPKQNET